MENSKDCVSEKLPLQQILKLTTNETCAIFNYTVVGFPGQRNGNEEFRGGESDCFEVDFKLRKFEL